MNVWEFNNNNDMLIVTNSSATIKECMSIND